MGASDSPHLAFPKQRPRRLDKEDKAAERDRLDARESAKVKARSGGQCEVRLSPPFSFLPALRCPRKAAPGNHHLIGGIGRRNKGDSILAAHRLAVCQVCHDDITGHTLLPDCSAERALWADQVVYVRRQK